MHVYRGDFNSVINRILSSGRIHEKKATFCLIDQFGSQCQWQTVKTISEFKTERKIEIFYFLASGWLDRMLEGFTRNYDIPQAWWGSADWRSLRGIKNPERARLFAQRFQVELGYRFAHPWPIYDRGDTGRIMFHMIHASDHPAAPELMRRAYVRVTTPRGSGEQLTLL